MSQPPCYTLLEDRGLLSVGGVDRVTFLQGLVSNDIEKSGPERAVYAALLTPQGKYLHDFFVVGLDDGLLLDCERARLDDLKKRLSMYKLRADITLDDRSGDFAVAALLGHGAGEALGLSGDAGAAAAFGGGVAYMDPRLAEAGVRAVLPTESAEKTLEDAGFTATGASDYDRLRLELGLPDGSRDLVVEKSILLESGFDELNGVDWDKGCFMGQELTARTKYRGLIKKRLVPVTFDGPPPAPDTPVMMGDEEAGELRSAVALDDGGIGLALLKIDAMAKAGETETALKAGGVTVIPAKPSWMTI
jgi:folate-binding protein YgfZ